MSLTVQGMMIVRTFTAIKLLAISAGKFRTIGSLVVKNHPSKTNLMSYNVFSTLLVLGVWTIFKYQGGGGRSAPLCSFFGFPLKIFLGVSILLA